MGSVRIQLALEQVEHTHTAVAVVVAGIAAAAVSDVGVAEDHVSHDPEGGTPVVALLRDFCFDNPFQRQPSFNTEI